MAIEWFAMTSQNYSPLEAGHEEAASGDDSLSSRSRASSNENSPALALELGIPAKRTADRLRQSLKSIKVTAIAGLVLAVLEVSLNIASLSTSTVLGVRENTDSSVVFHFWSVSVDSQYRLHGAINLNGRTTPGIWSGIPGAVLCILMLIFSHLTEKRGLTRRLLLYSYMLAASSVLMMVAASGAGYYALDNSFLCRIVLVIDAEENAPHVVTWWRQFVAITALCFLQVLICSTFAFLIALVHCLTVKSCLRTRSASLRRTLSIRVIEPSRMNTRYPSAPSQCPHCNVLLLQEAVDSDRIRQVRSPIDPLPSAPDDDNRP